MKLKHMHSNINTIEVPYAEVH